LSFLMTVTSNTACVLPIANIKTNINHLLESLLAQRESTLVALER
jgi:hypothetical protein